MKTVRKIAYFGEIEDIREMMDMTADQVMNEVASRLSAISIVNDEGERPFTDFWNDRVSLTEDGKYMVEWPGLDEVEKGDDCFIDIYEVVGDDDEYDGGLCDEWCPECECEVSLPRALGVYRCPNCGQWIVNCSMCYLQDECRCSYPNCPLSFEAKRRNEMEIEKFKEETEMKEE